MPGPRTFFFLALGLGWWLAFLLRTLFCKTICPLIVQSVQNTCITFFLIVRLRRRLLHISISNSFHLMLIIISSPWYRFFLPFHIWEKKLGCFSIEDFFRFEFVCLEVPPFEASALWILFESMTKTLTYSTMVLICYDLIVSKTSSTSRSFGFGYFNNNFYSINYHSN